MFVKNLINNIIDLQTTHGLSGVRFSRCFPIYVDDPPANLPAG